MVTAVAIPLGNGVNDFENYDDSEENDDQPQ